VRPKKAAPSNAEVPTNPAEIAVDAKPTPATPIAPATTGTAIGATIVIPITAPPTKPTPMPKLVAVVKKPESESFKGMI
jgi:hypothetical protein